MGRYVTVMYNRVIQGFGDDLDLGGQLVFEYCAQGEVFFGVRTAGDPNTVRLRSAYRRTLPLGCSVTILGWFNTRIPHHSQHPPIKTCLIIGALIVFCTLKGIVLMLTVLIATVKSKTSSLALCNSQFYSPLGRKNMG